MKVSKSACPDDRSCCGRSTFELHEERGWYFQRYVPHLPAAGEMVLLNRSWYNRAGVETVMGFGTARESESFLEDVLPFEHMLVGAGIQMMKDMTQEMTAMTERMSRGELTSEQNKQMSERMAVMANVMRRMSGLGARPHMKEADWQRQMDQMRKQMDDMKQHHP